jgi:hypothetical protein
VADELTGHSGYLSKPDTFLDPALFDDDGMTLHQDVRNTIVNKFFDWILRLGLNGAGLHLWITGSSISYQWNADRGPGDLDVMVGADFQKFTAANPAFDGWSVQDLSQWLNQKMYDKLWPVMASSKFHGKRFEVTYYFNTDVSDDIKAIKPYAAYDLIVNEWVVEPVVLPDNPGTLYNKEWYDAADRDTETTKELLAEYSRNLSAMEVSAPGTPDWHNAGAKLHVTLAKAGEMYHGIHTGRKQEFSSQGEGYAGWGNFRYQRAKASGAMDALERLNSIGSAAHADEETALYGAPLEPADVVLRRAAMMYKNAPPV